MEPTDHEENDRPPGADDLHDGMTLPDGDDAPPLTPLPDSIGRYRILGRLGEGGMGIVYEAEQEKPKRRVALKVIRGGQFVDDNMVRMFRREVETLGRLKHPSIGAIYESGHTDDGQHFFAMELVRGTTLDVYLDSRDVALDTAEIRFRLHLFRKIADAVHYAHQRGVIHRDLKPSNIIVSEEATRTDSTSTVSGVALPEVKILDFGLARITESDLNASTMTTEVGAIKGTLPYMSPEQARGDTQNIDLRSDVYALSVILYRMLTGKQPYDVLKGSLVKSIQVICEEAPRSLGQSWAGGGRIDTDVETIVGKGLEKDPERRYQSAAAFAEDVARYLTSQPIQARPPSTMYQLRKFAARNRTLVGGVAATFVVLIAGIVVSTWLGIRAEHQRRVAENEAARAAAVQEFMQDMIMSADPYGSKGPQVTMAEVLRSAARQVETAFTDQPAVQGGVRLSLGRLYERFNMHDSSIEQLEPARDLLQRAYPDGHRDLAECLTLLGEGYAYRNRQESIPMLKEAVDMYRSVDGPQSLGLAVALHDLAFAHMRARRQNPDSMLAISESLFAEALAMYGHVDGPEQEYTALCMTAMSWTIRYRGRTEEAVAQMREAFAIRERNLPPNSAPMWIAHRELANMLYVTYGPSDEVRLHSQRHLEIAREIYGEGSDPHVSALQYHDETLHQVDADPADIREVAVELLAARRARARADDAMEYNDLAWALLTIEPPELQDPVEALAVVERAASLPGGDVWQILDTQALAYFRNGRVAEAIRVQRRAVDLVEDQAAKAGLEERLREFEKALE